MNDPQDLLYTNQFLNTEIINQNEINEQSKNYDRFINYELNQNTESTNNTLNLRIKHHISPQNICTLLLVV